MSNAPSKPVSFSRPKVGYFSNRPRILHIFYILPSCLLGYTRTYQLDALISEIYFWNRNLHVSDRFSVHHQESSTVYTAIGICHTVLVS